MRWFKPKHIKIAIVVVAGVLLWQWWRGRARTRTVADPSNDPVLSQQFDAMNPAVAGT